MRTNKKLFRILRLVLVIGFLTENLFAGETFFLSRTGNKKLTFTGYYTSITTKADYKVGGANIPWEFSHKATIIQPSYKLSPKINVYGKIGISEISRKHSGTKTEQWGNFGDGFVFGLGMDYRLKKETSWPGLNLSFGLTRYHSAMANTIFYDINGERRVKTKTKISLNEFQLLVMANKTFGKFTVAAGAQENITTGEDVEEEFIVITEKGKDVSIEDFREGKGVFYIPENIYWAEKDKYDAAGYWWLGGIRSKTLEARNLVVSTKLETTKNSSLGLELLIGREFIVSAGLSIGF